MIAGIVALVILSVMIAVVKPTTSIYSDYEGKRRAKSTPNSHSIELDRYLFVDTVVWMRVVVFVISTAVLAILITLHTNAWTAVIVVIAVVMLGRGIATVFGLRHLTNWLYKRYEKYILTAAKFIDRYAKFLVGAQASTRVSIQSKEELHNIIEHLPTHVAGESDKQRIIAGVRFGEGVVGDVMVDAVDIKAIDVSETLGPLVQDDLYQSGYRYFPVIDRDINRVVGVLCTSGLLSVDRHKALHVKDVLTPEVVYVGRDWSLEHALEALVADDSRLAIVGERGKTMGIVLFSDIMRQLIDFDHKK